MANIYEAVEAYYEERPELEDVVPQNAVEQYFRRLTWRGASPDELVEAWELVSLLLRYTEEHQCFSCADLFETDYEELIYQYFERRSAQSPKEAAVCDVLQHIESFVYTVLRIEQPEELTRVKGIFQNTKDAFYASGTFAMPQRPADPWDFLDRDEESMDDLSDDAYNHLDDYINNVLEAFQSFYRAGEYRADIQRALYLFFGPERMKDAVIGTDESVQREFRAFWDFFMFDYHLMGNDKTPLAAFYEEKEASLSQDEGIIVRDLLKSHFMVFRIESIEGNAAVCQNLFSDELMDLPRPENLPKDYRKLLFYGHMHEEGVMLLNGLISVPATAALQRRIQQEIERLYDVYRVQEPDATINDFFARHSAAVRHLIRQMTSYAKLHAFPDIELKKPILGQGKKPSAALKAMERRLDYHLKALHFSRFERQLVHRLYRDYRAVRTDVEPPEREEIVLATATLLFAIHNLKDVGDTDSFFRLFHTTSDAVSECLVSFFSVLGEERPDARYLSETGFVNLMFDWSRYESSGSEDP